MGDFMSEFSDKSLFFRIMIRLATVLVTVAMFAMFFFPSLMIGFIVIGVPLAIVYTLGTWVVSKFRNNSKQGEES